MGLACALRDQDSQFGRVVKAWDLKSHGVTRAGSNPAADVSFGKLPELFTFFLGAKE